MYVVFSSGRYETTCHRIHQSSDRQERYNIAPGDREDCVTGACRYKRQRLSKMSEGILSVAAEHLCSGQLTEKVSMNTTWHQAIPNLWTLWNSKPRKH